jgi:hypothetical protein
MWLQKTKKVVLTSLKIFGAILAIFIVYICFIPPFGEIPRADTIKIEKLDPAKNALTEYNLAIQTLKSHSKSLGNLPLPQLNKSLSGQTPLTQQELSFVTQNQDCISHIIEASKSPYFQFYDHFPSYAENSLNLFETDALFSLANLQARQLADEGKIKEAVELALASYKLASLIVKEPNLQLWISSAVGHSGKAKSIAVLYYILTEKDPKADVLVNIAYQLQEASRTSPSPYETLLREIRNAQLTLDRCLVQQKEDKFLDDYFKVKYLPSGLRLRLYTGLIKRSQKNVTLFGTPLRQWDFQSAKVAAKLSDNLSSSFIDISIVDLLEKYSYNTGAFSFYILKGAYMDKATTMALETFAVSLAYKKAYGKFPSNIQEVFEQLNLEIPIDPVTNKIIGYRLEDNKPVVWFAGEDGEDNNGKENAKRFDVTESFNGKDIMFIYGEESEWFKF